MNSPDDSCATRVEVERECYIPVPKDRIVQSLMAEIDSPQTRIRFNDFCRLVEGIYHFEYHRTSNELKQDYRLFDNPGGAEARRNISDEELRQAEERFLLNFTLLMEKGNFRPLSQDDIDVAEAEDYVFSLPVRIDWQRLDTDMLGRFLAMHPSAKDGPPPDYAKYILIYRRGVGIDQTRGYLTLQKIDVLASYLLVGIWTICRGIGRFAIRLVGVGPSKPMTPAEEQPAKQKIVEPLSWQTDSPDRPASPQTRASSNASSQPCEADPSDEDSASQLEALSRPEQSTASLDLGDGDSSRAGSNDEASGRRFVERITLRNMGVSPLSLLRRTLIQEPTFQELILLFRFATPASGPTSGTADLGEAPGKDWDIHIKAFSDIPMADLEVVFPEKRISMKPLDLAKLIITGTIGVVMVLAKLLLSTLNPVIALAALGSMLGYAAKVFMGFKASKDRYQHLVTNSLYHKNLDNDLGVIFYLMDSLEEQEFKETVLGYYFLWTQGEMTQDELDRRCETFLQQAFDIDVDFEVDDALQKLARDDLVVQVGDRYKARPLDEALERLDGKWDNFFSYHHE